MDYVAVLGRQPEFGLLELESVLGAAPQSFGSQLALLGQLPNIHQLGGSLKLGRVLYHGPQQPLAELPIDAATLARQGKTVFGISLYGRRTAPAALTAAGLALKKQLRATAPARFIAPQSGLALSAAQIKYHRLLELGFELLIAYHHKQMLVAATIAVQDIDAYSARDYHRPARSATVGMLPPKLAQIMINTTPAATAVYDPFCGSGVVLQEALLLGRPAAGSDLAADMVQASRTNLEWLGRQQPLPAWSLSQADARSLQLPAGQDWAIVSEGYLGPALRRPPTSAQLAGLQTELAELYRSTLARLASQLPAGASVTITQPAWPRPDASPLTPLSVDQLTDLGYTVRQFAAPGTYLPIYRRPDQLVGRQLLILRKP